MARLDDVRRDDELDLAPDFAIGFFAGAFFLLLLPLAAFFLVEVRLLAVWFPIAQL